MAAEELSPVAPESEKQKRVPAKGDEAKQAKSHTKPSAGADLFLLDKLYPEADLVFQPTEQLDPRSDTVAIALDTNALLLPYLLGKGDLTALDSVYSQFAKEGRLFLPERVAREFIKNRDRKLAEMAQAIDDRISRIVGWDAKLTPLLLDGFPEREGLAKAGEELNAATKTYLELLRKLPEYVRNWRGDDPVTTLYAKIFTKERLIGPDESPENIIETLEYGLTNQVPPGYKDSSKDDRGIGDVVIWMSLLNLGKTTKNDLIFVTGEEKADWFVRSGGRPVYPRPELVDAYRRASGGRSLRLSSMHDLLKEMSAPDALVTEVEVAETTANNAIQAASTSVGTFANSAYVNQRAFTSAENNDVSYGVLADDFVPSSPEERELVERLRSLELQRNRLRSEITRLTGDDLNTSLSLPWNRAAHGFRSEESALSREIEGIIQRLRHLRR